MRLVNAAIRSASVFCADRSGSLFPIFCLALTLLLGAVGTAIDYGNSVRMQSMLQESVDAGALSAMKVLSSGGDVAATARAFVEEKIARTGLTSSVSTSSNSGAGTMTVSATMQVPTSLMKLFGISNVTVSAEATATAGVGMGKTEVALVFDTTGSMAGAKLSNAQQAANQLVDTLFTVPGTTSINPNVKVGLVPFTSYVNVGLQYRHASWLTGAHDSSSTSNQCWDKYPNATYTNPVWVPATCTADGMPYDCSYTSYTVNYGAPVQQCGPVTYSYTWNGCVGSQSSPDDEGELAYGSKKVPAMLNTWCAAPLTRLTGDPAELHASVDAMTADGETYIAPGLIWGWRLISPEQQSPFADGAPYGTANKIMILLTDGANTHSANYPDHEGSDVSAANAKVLATCTNIKAKGIKLYTIAFDVSDSAIISVLAQCSSGPPYAYNATTVSDLQGAFKSIGDQLTALRLVK